MTEEENDRNKLTLSINAEEKLAPNIDDRKNYLKFDEKTGEVLEVKKGPIVGLEKVYVEAKYAGY